MYLAYEGSDGGSRKEVRFGLVVRVSLLEGIWLVQKSLVMAPPAEDQVVSNLLATDRAAVFLPDPLNVAIYAAALDRSS